MAAGLCPAAAAAAIVACSAVVGVTKRIQKRCLLRLHARQRCCLPSS
jgi:hypothetical protein